MIYRYIDIQIYRYIHMYIYIYSYSCEWDIPFIPKFAAQLHPPRLLDMNMYTVQVASQNERITSHIESN